MARLHVVPSVGPYIIAATKPTDHSRCHVLRWEMMLVRKIGWKHGPRLPGVTCVRHQCSNQPRGQQSVALNVSVVTKCTAICQRSWPQEARSSSTVQFLVLARRNKCHKRRNLLQQAGANIRNPPCTTSYKMRSPNEFWKKTGICEMLFQICICAGSDVGQDLQAAIDWESQTRYKQGN